MNLKKSYYISYNYSFPYYIIFLLTANLAWPCKRMGGPCIHLVKDEIILAMARIRDDVAGNARVFNLISCLYNLQVVKENI